MISIIFFDFCFDKRNKSGQHLQVTLIPYHIIVKSNLLSDMKSKKLILILCFWQVKSNKFICICVLTGKSLARKIQIINLNLHFDSKFVWNYVWRENSNKRIWICVLTRLINLVNIQRLLKIFFQTKVFFDRRNPENWFWFCFLLVKSNESIWICVLTGKIQQDDLNSCFHKKRNLVSVKFIWNYVLKMKIHLKLCFDVKINLKSCYEVKIHLKFCFYLKIHLKLCL